MKVNFEGMDRRITSINKCLQKNGIQNLEEAKEICSYKKIFPEKIVRSIQRIAFDNAVWAYTLGCAIAIKNSAKNPCVAANHIGEALQSFCVPGSVAEIRKVGLGHGKLASKLLSEDTKCFAFIAGHESFAAAEGAIGIVKSANKARQTPLRVILNGLGKDAAYIISRINGFTYVRTDYAFETDTLKIISEKSFSSGERSQIKCYGANEPLEGLAILKHENVDISITGNSTNPTRF